MGLPVISFPVIESSSIAIITIYPGASAETVQGFVTEPIERAASSVPGLDYIESVTTAGTSTVTLWLQLNQDTTEVISTLSTRLSQIRFELPEGTEDPSIQISALIRLRQFLSRTPHSARPHLCGLAFLFSGTFCPD